jgi:RNA polymerase sigma-70 factor (ECF subfamily)
VTLNGGSGGDLSSCGSPREIFDRYFPRIRSFFKGRGFSDDEAADLTQETLLRVFKNIDRLRTRSSLEAWILRVASNLYKNEIRFRRAGKRAGHEVALDAAAENMQEALEEAALRSSPRTPNPLENALSKEAIETVDGCIEQLAPRMRQCLVAYAYQERKYQEIAELLSISIESVKAHIHQARRQLRECMSRKLAGGAK